MIIKFSINQLLLRFLLPRDFGLTSTFCLKSRLVHLNIDLNINFRTKIQLTQGPWKEATNIFWLTDSKNLVVFLKEGSSKSNIQQLVLEIMDLAKELNVVLLPIHLRREDPRIRVADAGSRVRDSDD